MAGWKTKINNSSTVVSNAVYRLHFSRRRLLINWMIGGWKLCVWNEWQLEVLLKLMCVFAECVSVGIGLSQSTLLSPVNLLTPLTAGAAAAAASGAKPTPNYSNVCRTTFYFYMLNALPVIPLTVVCPSLPYLTSGVGRLLHLPSAEAVSVRPNAQPRCNQRSQ